MNIKAQEFKEIVVVGEYSDFVPEIYQQIEENLKKTDERVLPASHARENTLRDKPLNLVCYGPSLQDTWEQVTPDSFVMTCSGAHDFMINHDIFPDWHVEMDWREHKADFVRTPCSYTDYLVASCVHPKMLENLQGQMYALWNVDMEPYYQYPEGELVFRNLLCAGLNSIIIAHALGFRNLNIYGMDCSFFIDGTRHAGQNITETDKYQWVKVGNRLFLTTPVFVAYAKLFQQIVQEMPDTKISLAGDGLLQASMKELQEINV